MAVRGCIFQAWFNLGNLERQCMRYEDALQCYKQVLGASPGHWRALLNSCIALVGLRRPKEAQAALAQALEISGTNPHQICHANEARTEHFQKPSNRSP